MVWMPLSNGQGTGVPPTTQGSLVQNFSCAEAGKSYTKKEKNCEQNQRWSLLARVKNCAHTSTHTRSTTRQIFPQVTYFCLPNIDVNFRENTFITE